MNEAGVSSEDVVGKARTGLAQRDHDENIKRFKYDVAQRTENS